MQEDKFYRADKLLEEEMENRLKVPTISEEERTRYTKDLTAADSFSREELGAKIKEYGECFMLTWDGDLLRFSNFAETFHAGIKAPETGNELTDPYEFNLMFPTPIGPSGLLQVELSVVQHSLLDRVLCCVVLC